MGIESINPFELPLLNTVILLLAMVGAIVITIKQKN